MKYNGKLSGVCAVIPVHNGKEILSGLLGHLASLTDEISLADIIVVDDGSTDGTAAMLAEHYPMVTRLEGDGNLLWTGAIRRGMEHALACGYTAIYWINHDCRPDPGALRTTFEILQQENAGCVSAWCYIDGYPEYPVNPGFRNLLPIPILKLRDSAIVEADGLNGNCVCFSTIATRAIGLPDPKRFPHYGDGPYTILFSRAGFPVLVATEARASLGYEVERRLRPFWRVAISNKPLLEWASYYFTSFRSQYHWRYRWNDSLHFRGLFGILAYLKNELQVATEILIGAVWRACSSRSTRVDRCVKQHSSRWPKKKILAEIG